MPFSDYSIIAELAQGSRTIVFEATHPNRRDRRMALQVLRSGANTKEFLWAARLNAWLDHPRIPRIFEVGEFQGQLYMVRHFVEGTDLQNNIGGATRPAADVARIVAEVANALDYAHGRGVVHGYVHPRHILLDCDGSAWLIGFGEYSPADNPIHFAPEQLDAGGAVSPRTDVYALSETAFWLLTGCHPFSEIRHSALVAAKRDGRLRRGILDLRQDIPRGVDPVLRQGLAPCPEDRFASAGDFAAALSAAIIAPGQGPGAWWRFGR
jgi:serine/threonine protein kinase